MTVHRAHALAWIVVGITASLGLYLTYQFSAVFGPLLAALGIAYILEPLVAKLTARGMSRRIAVVWIFGVFSLVAVAVGVGIGLQAARLVELVGKQDVLGDGARIIEDWIKQALPSKQGEAIPELGDSQVVQTTLEFVKTVVTAVVGTMVSLTNLATVLLLTPIYLAYLMLELPLIWGWVVAHVPARDRERTTAVLGEMHAGMAAFLRGRVIVALIKGLATAAGLIACGTSFAFVVGMASGVLSILPFVGPVVGFVVAVALTLSQGVGVAGVVGVCVVFLAAEMLEGFAIMPWVMRQGVSLHPLTVLVSIFFWGTALGLFGALLAIPLTLVAKILLKHYVLPSLEELAAAE